MTSQLRTPKGQLALGAVALAALLAAAWFLAISPKRSEAVDLEAQVAAARTELDAKRAALQHPSAEVDIRAADLFRLTKALPDAIDGAAVVLDVNRLAKQNSLSFFSITPSMPVAGVGSYLQQPYGIVLEGRFASVSRFLAQLRSLVTVRNKRLDVRGRLYSVDQVEMGQPEGEKSFPNVKATVTVNAFGFLAPPPAVPGDATATDTTTDTSSGTVAAGATP